MYVGVCTDCQSYVGVCTVLRIGVCTVVRRFHSLLLIIKGPQAMDTILNT